MQRQYPTGVNGAGSRNAIKLIQKSKRQTNKQTGNNALFMSFSGEACLQYLGDIYFYCLRYSGVDIVHISSAVRRS